jgi:hypothetical protein
LSPADSWDGEAQDSILAFTHGDRVAAEQLRRALRTIRDHVDDPEVARVASRVLDGSTTLRQATRDPDFLGSLGRGMDTFAREWEQLGPEERVALAEQGKRDSEAMAQEIGLPGEDDPAPVGDFGPARTEPRQGPR